MTGPTQEGFSLPPFPGHSQDRTPEERERREALEREIGEVAVIMSVIQRRLADLNFFQEEHVEAVAYRLAEILVTAKNVYADILPRFSRPLPQDRDESLDLLLEMRMNLLHMKDLVEEFEETLYPLMK